LVRRYTARYRIQRLVYCEIVDDPMIAIAREKQIKGYRREKKIDLIRSMNPAWNDFGTLFGLTTDPSLRSG
jgi:putative endonuclease